MSQSILRTAQRLAGQGANVMRVIRARQLERSIHYRRVAKDWMRPLSSSATADADAKPSNPQQQQDWRQDPEKRLWEALYEKDYRDRAQMAMFVNALQDFVEEKRANGELKKAHEEHIRVKPIYSSVRKGIHLPPNITPEFVESMAEQMLEKGDRLTLPSFERLLTSAEEVLGAEPNIIHLPRETKLTVVGDLHGALWDLCLILDMVGRPSPENKYLFNGDFVDRGKHSVEVLSILLALKIVYPDSVFLNRGNHEDLSVGRAYGFFDEVMQKYGSADVYSRIGDVFVRMPLCTVLDRRALIVHAGPPCFSNDATIYHIGAIARKEIKSTVVAAWDGRDADGRYKKRPKSLSIVEDMLWSDPINPFFEPATRLCVAGFGFQDHDVLNELKRQGSENIVERNFIRQAGSRFGTDEVKKWCKNLNVQCMVRSHEMVMAGVEEIKCGDGLSLWTVFSSSHYQESGNDGGYLVFDKCEEGEPSPLPRAVIFHPRGGCSVREGNRQKLIELICRHKPALRAALTLVAEGSPTVSLDAWDRTLRSVLNLDICFKEFRKDLAGRVKAGMENKINIKDFLSRYKLQVHAKGGEKQFIEDDFSIGILFSNRKDLATIFQLMDLNSDGQLSREEVNVGCEMLNKRLPPDCQINPDQIFGLMDTDKSGEISVDEFIALWSQQAMSSVDHPAL